VELEVQRPGGRNALLGTLRTACPKLDIIPVSAKLQENMGTRHIHLCSGKPVNQKLV
jgi:hypothetical protein